MISMRRIRMIMTTMRRRIQTMIKMMMMITQPDPMSCFKVWFSVGTLWTACRPTQATRPVFIIFIFIILMLFMAYTQNSNGGYSYSQILWKSSLSYLRLWYCLQQWLSLSFVISSYLQSSFSQFQTDSTQETTISPWKWWVKIFKMMTLVKVGSM